MTGTEVSSWLSSTRSSSTNSSFLFPIELTVSVCVVVAKFLSYNDFEITCDFETFVKAAIPLVMGPGRETDESTFRRFMDDILNMLLLQEQC